MNGVLLEADGDLPAARLPKVAQVLGDLVRFVILTGGRAGVTVGWPALVGGVRD